MKQKKYLKIFAERLKMLREEKGLTLQKLGKEIGISGVAIGRWERLARIPTIDSLVLLASFFGVSTDYLMGLED